MKYYGFDLGDGESAVAFYESDSAIEPKIVPIYGQSSFISAVGVRGGETLIGEQACTDVPSEGLSVRFKSRFVNNSNTADLSRFSNAVTTSLMSDGGFQMGDSLIVGCPAGWNSSERKRYQDVMCRLSGIKPRIVSESRAAFLYAKYAKTVALDIDILNAAALVMDFGSSTLDYAYIVDGHETGVGTFGETRLGGGILDAALLRRSIQKSPDSRKLESVFQESQSWYSYCEIEARHLKEEYFLRLGSEQAPCVRKQVKIYYDDIQKLMIELNAEEVDTLIHQPLEDLNGLSFYEALRGSLMNAKRITSDNPPQVILITGGASRMPFFSELCGEIFSGTVLVKCPEPEFSIAKGLAYAGWVDDNLLRFRTEIAKRFDAASIAGVLSEHMDSLIDSVSRILADLILNRIAIPASLEWQRGEIDTLSTLQKRIAERAQNILMSETAQNELRPAVAEWLSGITDELQKQVDGVCDVYNVPRKEMQLRLSRVGTTEISVDAGQWLNASVWSNAISIIISLVCAGLCGGGGVALIATGPLGFLAGAVIGAIVGLLGHEVLNKVIAEMRIPVLLRHVNLQKSLQSERTVTELEKKIRSSLHGNDSAFAKQIQNQFSVGFSDYINQIASAAEIPIE